MKAVVLHDKGGPESLRIEEVDTPQAGPGEVRGILEWYWNIFSFCRFWLDICWTFSFFCCWFLFNYFL